MSKKEEDNILIKELIKKNKIYSDNIEFTAYCESKIEERNIDEEIVIKSLSSNIPYYAEEQEVYVKGNKEKRYKLIYKISSRYSLIIIVLYKEKILKVINVIKTSKSVEKLWRKKISG